MARPIWSGAITFGIVSIPVAMFAAVHEHGIHFHQISRKDRRRIHYRKVVEGSEQTVPEADIAKGYEVRNGRYVVFDDLELKRIAARRSTAIDIESFVRLDEIDPRLFEQVYYLAPGKGGDKPYQLLKRALDEAELVGVSRLVLHAREHVVIVRSLADVLALQTLRFADEIAEPRRVLPDLPHGTVSPQELALAGKLIASMAGSFSAKAYDDQYLARLKAAIARKARGQTVPIAEDEPRVEHGEGKVIDLMAALDRSLRQRRGAANSRSLPRRELPASRRASRSGSAARARSGHPPSFPPHPPHPRHPHHPLQTHGHGAPGGHGRRAS